MTTAIKDADKVSDVHDNPPWYARNPDGKIILGAVPDRLLCYPELQRRGIVLREPMKPGVAFRSFAIDDGPPNRGFVVKVLDLDTEELEIYERLLNHLNSPQNHTIPCEIVRSGHPMLIMPLLTRIELMIAGRGSSLSGLLDIFYQLIEGLAYLHQHSIAHMDLCPGNVAGALEPQSDFHASLKFWQVYIYDFDTSLQFAHGPGRQHAITLPESQIPPPSGLTYFDPYSWDVYCLGHLLDELMDHYVALHTKSPPWLLRRYARWLIGNERGCTSVCRCRPTAKGALRVMSAMRSVASLLEWCSSLCETISHTLFPNH
ncbi:kinase-like domain-containing protein [Cubamyces menziesii]|nr:kinase-like domain-containing protein [Cubamyces menziesii]